jgi:hypothetical protein
MLHKLQANEVPPTHVGKTFLSPSASKVKFKFERCLEEFLLK